MAKETEHKYLVTSDIFMEMSDTRHLIIQGYLSRVPSRTVRVRIWDKEAFLTIKGKTVGDTRLEFEYAIPFEEGCKLLELCEGTPLKKERWIVYYEGYKWEVDRFLNRDVPTVAEIELPFSHHDYPLPPFVGPEVTGNPSFYNSNL